MPETRAVSYLAMLNGIPEDQLIFALRKCLDDSSFFPTDADIRKKVRSLRNPAYQTKQIEEGSFTTAEERAEVKKFTDAFVKKMGW